MLRAWRLGSAAGTLSHACRADFLHAKHKMLLFNQLSPLALVQEKGILGYLPTTLHTGSEDEAATRFCFPGVQRGPPSVGEKPGIKEDTAFHSPAFCKVKETPSLTAAGHCALRVST